MNEIGLLILLIVLRIKDMIISRGKDGISCIHCNSKNINIEIRREKRNLINNDIVIESFRGWYECLCNECNYRFDVAFPKINIKRLASSLMQRVRNIAVILMVLPVRFGARPEDFITKARQVDCTFATKTTGILNCENRLLSSLEIPDEAAINGTTITILGAFKSTDTFLAICEMKGGLDYTLEIVKLRHIPVNPFDFAGYNYLKFVCSDDVDTVVIKATLRSFD